LSVGSDEPNRVWMNTHFDSVVDMEAMNVVAAEGLHGNISASTVTAIEEDMHRSTRWI